MYPAFRMRFRYRRLPDGTVVWMPRRQLSELRSFVRKCRIPREILVNRHVFNGNIYICRYYRYVVYNMMKGILRKTLIVTGYSALLSVFSLSPLQARESYMEKAERFSADSLGKYLNNLSPNVRWIDGGRKMAYTPKINGEYAYYIVNTKTWKARKYKDKDEFEKAVDRYSGKKEFRPFASKGNRRYSCDSAFYVTSLDHNLFLYNVATGDSTQLSFDGEPYFSYDFIGRNGRNCDSYSTPVGKWVEDTHCFVFIREDSRKVGTLSLVNSLTDGRPEVETYKFAMPGDTAVVKYNVMVVDADSAKLYDVDQYKYADQIYKAPRFCNYPCADGDAWLLRHSRTCDTLDLCRVDVQAHKMVEVISEVCKPHYNEQLHSYHVINCGKEVIWWSERTGKGQYYLYDGNGKLKNRITDGDFVCGPIVDIDTLGRSIIFEGYGREKGINPHYCLYYKASLDGDRPVELLTPDNGHHKISFSPDKKFIVDSWSRMDLAPQHRICDRDGKLLFSMQGCDVSELENRGWRYPEVISLKAADGVTDLYGVVYLPFEIEPGKKYPIISSVYPGPHTDLVPQEFFLDDNYNQSLAQLGFVVINFSYRGSCPYRGRDYYDFGYGNLRDYALEDDYCVIRQIAEKYPFADLDRVGIYGHSGGGFMTVAAMLARPDFYKVGVAASGNHDNNIYLQWWGETFHGVKNLGNGRFECRIPTNIENAAKLNGRLMLITGDMDNNVHPASTYRLAHALIRNNKRFDMMIFPGVDHGIGDSYYFNLVRYYFTEHLLGLPQNDIDIVNHE